MPVLGMVEEELDRVISVTRLVQLPVILRGGPHAPATVTQVADSLRSAPFAHIACHGIQNASDALSSGFCLQDGDLTVSQLMKLNLKSAFLAFLSACETAKGDQKQPDQIVHLAATMLFVGFKSVIATMW
jgi:CHAT domain-containing protein